MTILGIDPALNTTGYAIISKNSNGTFHLVESGVIKNKGTDDFPKKLLHLFEIIDHLCTLYKPSICGIEMLAMGFALFTIIARPSNPMIIWVGW